MLDPRPPAGDAELFSKSLGSPPTPPTCPAHSTSQRPRRRIRRHHSTPAVRDDFDRPFRSTKRQNYVSLRPRAGPAASDPRGPPPHPQPRGSPPERPPLSNAQPPATLPVPYANAAALNVAERCRGAYAQAAGVGGGGGGLHRPFQSTGPRALWGGGGPIGLSALVHALNVA